MYTGSVSKMPSWYSDSTAIGLFQSVVNILIPLPRTGLPRRLGKKALYRKGKRKMKNPGTKTGKKHKFTMGMAVLLFSFDCSGIHLPLSVSERTGIFLSGYNAVLSGDVTFYPIEFTLDAYKQILGRAQIWIAMRVTIFVTHSWVRLSGLCSHQSLRHMPCQERTFPAKSQD